MAERVAIAVLAKAPVSGLAKSRLIPALGAEGAAALAAAMIEHTVVTAASAAIGPVALWATPDETHPLFQSLSRRFSVALARQPDGDLGARMHAAFVAANAPTLVVGTDCPILTAGHLRTAALALHSYNAAVIPAEDGGYVLIGLRDRQAALFADMAWSTSTVMAETRQRLRSRRLSCREFDPLWDVDTPEDLLRLQRERPDLF